MLRASGGLVQRMYALTLSVHRSTPSVGNQILKVEDALRNRHAA
jgi:hypothetical protein